MCYADDACDVFNETTVKARKPHRCDECGAPIPVECIHVRIGTLYEGSWSSLRVHHECRVLWGAVHLDLCEGEGLIMIGGLSEELSEYDSEHGTYDEDTDEKVASEAAPYRARLEAIREKYAAQAKGPK